MGEVDDSPENIQKIIERTLCHWLGDRKQGEELTTWVMNLLADYEWGPTHGLWEEN